MEIPVTVVEQGVRAVVTVRCPDPKEGLYKAYLHGRCGGVMLLGTLMPEAGYLTLKRTLSVAQMRQCGVWPVASCKGELVYSPEGDRPPKGWQWHRGTWPLVKDTELLESIDIQGKTMVQNRGEGCWMGWPYDTDKEFPLTPLFCLATIIEVEGRPYVRYGLDEKGWPVV